MKNQSIKAISSLLLEEIFRQNKKAAFELLNGKAIIEKKINVTRVRKSRKHINLNDLSLLYYILIIYIIYIIYDIYVLFPLFHR